MWGVCLCVCVLASAHMCLLHYAPFSNLLKILLLDKSKDLIKMIILVHIMAPVHSYFLKVLISLAPVALSILRKLFQGAFFFALLFSFPLFNGISIRQNFQFHPENYLPVFK